MRFELGILASPTSPNLNPANNDAFDDWLAHVHQAFAGVRDAARTVLAAGTPASAPTASAASDIARVLTGRWRLQGSSPDEWFSDATLDMNSNGTFTGRFVLFGGIPEGCPVTGTWFFAMGVSEFIAFQGKALEPQLDEGVEISPFAVPIQLLVDLEQITADKIVGEVLDENAPIEFVRLP